MMIRNLYRQALLSLAMATTAVPVLASDASADSYSYLGEFSVGYKYQEMEADTIRYAWVKTIGMNIVQFTWSPSDASWARDRKWLSSILPTLSYEQTPGTAAEQDQIAEISESSKQGWKRFVGTFDLQPVTMLTDAESSPHHIDIGLDVQTFLVTVQATRDYFYIDSNDATLLVAGDQLDLATTFTEARLGYRYQGDSVSWSLGAFQLDYEKPISSDVDSPMEYIYKAAFKATGASLGLGFHPGNLQLDFGYDLSTDADATVNGGVSLSRDQYGIDENITYTAYRATLSYDLQDFLFGLPLYSRLNYVERHFTTWQGENLNDDRIIDLSLVYKFML